jgi:hypothetical protein
MATITRRQVDLWQGDTEVHGPHVKCEGRSFGFVHGDDGGYFFTWLPTLGETLASVEEDSESSDGGLDRAEVVDFLRGYLPRTAKGREMWEAAE